MYYFIVNPQSSNGRGRKIWDKVLRHLNKTKNASNFEAYITEKSGDAREFAHQLSLKCQDAKTITVIGGEGTLNEVVDGINMDSNRISIAYIPTKTDNDIARSFRRKYNLKAQLKRLFTDSDEILLDYGVLNCPSMNRRFAISSGAGIDAAIFNDLYDAKCRSGKRSRRFFQLRKLLYIKTFMREFFKVKPTKGYVVLDGEKKHEFNNILFISAHVHPYEGGYKVCPDASGEDGCLDVCIVSTRHKWRLLWIMFSSVYGQHVTRTGVHLYRCREIEVHTNKPLPVHVDGESAGKQSDFTLNCIPKKLKLRL
ncbi:diacylglycerol/lipid kinase family protein [Oribacterium sp. WCC10]|uniref:diacylglycerol/lipid kinase family protein n=1 Tax=Oribacterium sp. WCC10 TaxID=1855343 RepID=UPI0008E6F8F4|nr:YegS/Rv2252/BmrU family lipid kinase [Oribacterium sp. WCC10]SFG48412.1 lipid kinase, YegS/Rv2252/BmrU family [Oribacterium sp. WCC10]